MGSSKNLLMETSSLRPYGERMGRGGGEESGGEEGEGRRGGGEKGREKRMEVGGEGATNRLGPWTNRVWLVTKCKGGLLGVGPTKMATCLECADTQQHSMNLFQSGSE